MERDQAHEQDGIRGEVRLPSDADGDARVPAPQSDHLEPEWRPSAEWLAGEDRADDDIRTGRVRRFDSVDELLADLHAASTESKRGAD